ncbi:hypothetical protein MRX96_059603 [Rhipicephalus microplus]
MGASQTPVASGRPLAWKGKEVTEKEERWGGKKKTAVKKRLSLSRRRVSSPCQCVAADLSCASVHMRGSRARLFVCLGISLLYFGFPGFRGLVPAASRLIPRFGACFTAGDESRV